MKKLPEKSSAPAPAPAPVHRMTLTRDDLYQLVNASYHAGLELHKSPMFAIGNRGWAYDRIARKMDSAYIQLVECGMDAVFEVQFFLKEKKADSQPERRQGHEASSDNVQSSR